MKDVIWVWLAVDGLAENGYSAVASGCIENDAAMPDSEIFPPPKLIEPIFALGIRHGRNNRYRVRP